MVVAELFTDVVKAFDTVEYVILLEQLWKAGFRGICYEWLRSYLLNEYILYGLGSV